MEVERRDPIFSFWSLARTSTALDTAFRAVDQPVVFIVEIKLRENPRSVNEECWRHSCWLRIKE
ncbi:hypothetical protein BK659_14100 [Pseudomonas brassicacearum]|uniref:Uncharacterized protein n=1 Tax=Pseudomonas brassicacearum TaxID=930166 RepID=A0A423H5P3_9PSED|nr:hypothetical protein BK659_14100 [Pseudomonas brassicacearum]